MNPANVLPLPVTKPQHWGAAFMRPAQLARKVRSPYGAEKFVTPKTIRAWIDEGKIRAFYLRKRGKKISGFLIPMDECERVIAHGPIAAQMVLPGMPPVTEHFSKRMEAVS